MEVARMKAERRSALGRNQIKKLRTEGWMPAVIYGGDPLLPRALHFTRLFTVQGRLSATSSTAGRAWLASGWRIGCCGWWLRLSWGTTLNQWATTSSKAPATSL